jgi:hypothetical protein
MVNQIATKVDFFGLVVEGHGRHPQDVGSPKIEKCTILMEILEQVFSPLAHRKRLLATKTARFAGGDEFNGMRSPPILNVLESMP